MLERERLLGASGNLWTEAGLFQDLVLLASLAVWP